MDRVSFMYLKTDEYQKKISLYMKLLDIESYAQLRVTISGLYTNMATQEFRFLHTHTTQGTEINIYASCKNYLVTTIDGQECRIVPENGIIEYLTIETR